MSDQVAVRERRSFAVRVSLLFAAICVIIGTNLPFLPVWLDWTGLTAREIAIVTAVPLFVRVVATPIIAYAADRSGDHRRFLIGLAWSCLAALLLLSQMRGFWLIFACMVIFSIAWTTIMPLAETVAMGGVRAAKLDYGRMRLWGSISFIVASVCGGWVLERLGAASAIWLVIAGGAMTVAATHALLPPTALPGGKEATAGRRIDLAGAVGLLKSRTFLVLRMAGGCGPAAQAGF
jgi:PPP family 3-phenylpropionic acid transporter